MLNFSFPCPASWISTGRCLSLDSDWFLRARKHSKAPVLPERSAHVSEHFELFFVVPLLTALLWKVRRLPGNSNC